MIKKLIAKVKAFGGITHILISVLLVAIVLVGLTFKDIYIKFEYHYILVAFAYLGGSLLPDLDSNRSTAVFRLGLTGRVMNIFMQSTGKALWYVYHFKYDSTPRYKHRVFYHTLLFSSLLIYGSFSLPSSNLNFYNNLMNTLIKDLPYFIYQNFLIFFYVFLSAVSIRLLIGTLTYFPFKKIFKRQHISDIFVLLISIVSFYIIIKMEYYKIRNIAIGSSFGYLSHLIGDLFTTGSIPLFYPIPIKRQAYFRPNFKLQIENTKENIKTLNRVLRVISFMLFIYLFYVYII